MTETDRPTDAELLDFLADREQWIANVQLPRECVENHPASMRDAIAMAMRIYRANTQAEGSQP